MSYRGIKMSICSCICLMKLYKQGCEHISSHSSILKVLNHFPLLPMCSHPHTLPAEGSQGCWWGCWRQTPPGWLVPYFIKLTHPICSSSRCLQGGLELSPATKHEECLQGLWGEYLTAGPQQWPRAELGQAGSGDVGWLHLSDRLRCCFV